MDALKELFTTWTGLLSLGTIVGIVAIGGFLLRLLLKKVDESRPPSA